MANGTEKKNRHFILYGFTEVESYRSPQENRRRSKLPELDRQQHGTRLLNQVAELRFDADTARAAQQTAGLEEGLGLRIEFESFPDIELVFESLARERSGIELYNVRHDERRTYATVFVPDGQLDHFEKLIQDYLAEKQDKRGHPRDNKRLINTIRAIRAASIRALWTDDEDTFPTESEGALWWEVWLHIRKDRDTTVRSFRTLTEAQGMRAAPDALSFPERTVLQVRASLEQMQRSMLTLNSIAELRRAKETAEFFDALPLEEQPEWMDDLLARTSFVEDTSEVPHVCLLDTGVSRGHPLLRTVLAANDLHTVEPVWGVGDNHGHGTEMAGLALAGDLTHPLAAKSAVHITHRLESVKLVPNDLSSGNDPRHHGYLTVQAVTRPEVNAPARLRVFAMAVTARDNRDRGRPSAWSAAVDSLAADSHGNGANPRLLVVSAGNVRDPNAWFRYPASNDTDSVHDPAQAWNALTVGAYTELMQVTGHYTHGYHAIAPRGGLSPFSTTSLTWPARRPLKPDVVFEGGNAAKDTLSAVSLPSLSLLTTDYRPTARLFTTANATSAATALAARLSAQVMAIYPALWPETIRALVVHSAEWTSTMRKAYLPSAKEPSKSDYRRLVRRCGFGVPDLDRALWSVGNSLTMVVQESLNPFKREPGKQDVTLCDMHLHSLPWPRESLENLGDTSVEMRVTLSYFIEPNPSERGRSGYRYESHSLRFDVKRPSESAKEFRARINAAARDEEAGNSYGGEDTQWLIGTQTRHRGSLHSDIWRGNGADLASRECIAVYPAMGWWKTRTALKRYSRAARYALVISIKAPEIDVDLYTEVANNVATTVAVET